MNSGFLNINKPVGLTSHDVVARVRRILGTKKIGHAGTLDPLATGVLILCIGSATRLSEYIMAGTKRYLAVIQLGVETTTYDAEGEVVALKDASTLTLQDVTTVLPAFLGDIHQVPPPYSAIKQDGQRLYKLARQGKPTVPKSRPTHIDSLEIKQWAAPILTLDIVCSAGTYIRSVAHDLGAMLGVGGSLTALTRTASGAFTLENSISLDDLRASPDPFVYLISPAHALPSWAQIILSGESLNDICHGRSIVKIESHPLAERVLGLDESGELIAVLRSSGDCWSPQKVFIHEV